MFVCVSYLLRQRVVEKYYVNEPESCCCGPCNPCCEALHINCNYPCAMFQMYVSMKEWDRELKEQKRLGFAPSAASTPTVSPISPPTSPQRIQQQQPQPSAPPMTPVAVPRDSAHAYAQNQFNPYPTTPTPAQAIVVDAHTGVQVAMPVATPIGAVYNYN